MKRVGRIDGAVSRVALGFACTCAAGGAEPRARSGSPAMSAVCVSGVACRDARRLLQK